MTVEAQIRCDNCCELVSLQDVEVTRNDETNYYYCSKCREAHRCDCGAANEQ